jgi:outer membrane protein assembly factor BamB
MKTPMRKSLWLGLGVMLALQGCSSLNPFSSGDKKLPALKPVAGQIRLDDTWRVKVGASDAYTLQPAAVLDVIFAAGDDQVMRIEKGRRVWKTDVGAPVSGGVGADADNVLVATPKGEVLALAADTGKVRWRVRVGAEVLAAPAIVDDVVVVRASDGRLFGLELADGKQRWTYQRVLPPLAVRSAAGVVVDNKMVFVGFSGGKLVALNPQNGNLMWEGTVAVPKGTTELERVADIASLPVMGPKAACAVAYQGRLACFDPANGSVLWTRDISSAAGLDMDDKAVFVADDKGAIHALDLSTGASLWKQEQLVGRTPARPRVLGNYLVVADVEGIVHFLSRDDGAFVARQKTDGSPVLADPLRVNGEYVVQTRNGSVYGLAVQ